MMTVRPRALCLLMSRMLVGIALTWQGVARAHPEQAVVMSASAPAGTDTRVKSALRKSVTTHVTDLGLVRKLRDYTIVPALIALQDVVDLHEQQPGLDCVVELILHDSARGVVASVRAKVSSVGATRAETVEAAARAAVNRLSETLVALKKQAERRVSTASR